MNCSVCGGPLLFDRVVFRCSCGTYIHAYCADKHIVQAHRPAFEEGHVDLNGDFHLKNEPVETRVPTLNMPAAVTTEAEEAVLASSSVPDEVIAAEEEEAEAEEEVEPDEAELAGEENAAEEPDEGR